MMRRRPRRWRLVIFALVMMVGSGLLGHYAVSHNGRTLRAMEQEAARIGERIDGQWQAVERFERNAGYVVTLSMLARLEKGEERWKLDALRDDAFRHLLPGWASGADVSSLKRLMEEADSQRARTIERINLLYGERIALVQRAAALEEDNRMLTSLAFFMQLLGVVLVTLTRDMEEDGYDF